MASSIDNRVVLKNSISTFICFQKIRLSAFYVCFVLEKCLCKKLNFFFNRSKDVLVAHCCFSCLASLDKEGTIYLTERATRTEISVR